jgi:hypothetical protein
MTKHTLPDCVEPWPDEHATVKLTVGGKALPCCLWCGLVKPSSGWKSKCRGKVKVELRTDPSDLF